MLGKAWFWLMALGLLWMPTLASAAQIHTYEFRDHGINAEWNGMGGMTMQKQPTGVLLSTQDQTGALVTDMEPLFLADAGTVVMTAEQPGRLHFVWVFADDPLRLTNSVSAEFDVGVGQSLHLPLHHVPSWQHRAKRIGLVLPPHTTIVLHRIEMTRWNVIEKSLASFVSFWMPDTLRAYTINFMWGPQIEPIPAGRTLLFSTPPPRSFSATTSAYVLMAVLIVGLFVWTAIKKRPHDTAVRTEVLMILAVWMVFDLRMGGEFLLWMTQDASEYTFANGVTRTFRDRGRFYDFAAFVKPLVADRSSYIFVAETPWPYLGNMRYVTYPSVPNDTRAADDTWVIYDRPDIDVDVESRLTTEGRPASPPGKIIGRFDANSFVFRTTSIPPVPSP